MSLFGTDGIRGVANKDLTPSLATKLGKSLHLFTNEGDRILIGRDTRRSGPMLAHALASGISSIGRNALFLGIIPTPAVPLLLDQLCAEVGIMISASHNLAQDNGIKFFDADGFKFSRRAEKRVEEFVENQSTCASSWEEIGTTDNPSNPSELYFTLIKQKFPGSLPNLEGLHVGVDCAHGATYQVAPDVLSNLGATITTIGTHPTGENINRDCGSTNLKNLQRLILSQELDLGIAFDGDGDRVLLIDENGEVVDGDRILFIAADWFSNADKLKPNVVVSTVMSNLGLEITLSDLGIELIRTQVGDKYVAQEMRSKSALLGGEQSGHIIFSEVNTTGDGLLTTLMILKILIDSGSSLSELGKKMKRYPQVLKNISTDCKEEFSDNECILNKINHWESQLGDKGRILVRPSGTQDVIRVMVEANSEETANQVASNLGRAIDQELNQ